MSDETPLDLAARFVGWLETGRRPPGMLAPDVFGDVSLPHWRLQTSTDDDLYAIRENDHPAHGEVRVEALDLTARGFLLQFEERWQADAQSWYCRELIHAVVDGNTIREVAVYCTGDWDEQTQQRHATEVRLTRP